MSTKLQVATEKNLNIPVDQRDVDELYRALKEPVQTTQHSKLSPDYLSRLHLKFENITAQMENQLSKRSMQLSEALARPTLETVTELIHLNAKTKRVAEAQQAFDSLAELGLVPDLVAYNHLMHAYAAVDNLAKVKDIFGLISANQLRPDLVSYSTLINSLVEKKEIDEAFVVYEEMKSKGIKPNQIVFCTLIKGCLKAKQFDRAWKTFDHLRSIDTPDGITYSLMINACSKTQEAEKALDLFQEMASYGIAANEATFNGLIRACGSRSDYYKDSFLLMEQMIQEGFEPSLETYHNLFEITSAHGDVQRARTIWNDFISRVDYDHLDEASVVPSLIPHQGIMQSMLKLYTNAWINGVYKETIVPDAQPPLPEKVEVDLDAKPTKPKDNGLVYLSSVETDKPTLATEAALVWEMTETLVKQGKMSMSGGLLASRLAMLCEIPGDESIDIAYEFFKTKFKQYKIEPMGICYKTLLRCSWYRRNKVSVSEQIWNEFLEWDRHSEDQLNQTATTPLTLKEKESKRSIQARQAQVILDCFYITARGYCRAGQLEKSLEILEATKDFRYPYYLPPLHLKEIKNILVTSQNEAENGNLVPLQKLQQLIPPRQDHVSQIQTILKRKYLPSSWWGWTAMGLDDKERAAMIKKHQRESRKVMQREMELRRKGAEAQRNRFSKVKVFQGRNDLID
jgi:pentatricopeptide repeat protein